MPLSKQLPASIRYLKARLNVLKRPTVWGSAFVVVISLILLAEAWNHPERLAIGGDDGSTERAESASPPEPTALDPFSSVEEPSLDGSPDASSNPFEQSPESEPQSVQGQSAQGQSNLANSDVFDLDAFLLDPTLSIPVPSQPRTTQSPLFQPPSATSDSTNALNIELPNFMSLTGASSLPDATNTSGGLRSGSTDSLITSDDRSSLNPLQSALDRYAAPTSARSDTTLQPTVRSDSSTQPNPLSRTSNENGSPTPLTNSYYLPQPLPGQPSIQQTLPQPLYVPQTSPYPGTTGYTLPPALRTPTIPDSTGTGMTGYGSGYTNLGQPQPLAIPQSRVPLALPSTIQSATFGAGYPVPVQPLGEQPATPLPFSVPRAAPGQYIGGGQINTFANP